MPIILILSKAIAYSVNFFVSFKSKFFHFSFSCFYRFGSGGSNK